MFQINHDNWQEVLKVLKKSAIHAILCVLFDWFQCKIAHYKWQNYKAKDEIILIKKKYIFGFQLCLTPSNNLKWCKS